MRPIGAQELGHPRLKARILIPHDSQVRWRNGCEGHEQGLGCGRLLVSNDTALLPLEGCPRHILNATDQTLMNYNL